MQTNGEIKDSMKRERERDEDLWYKSQLIPQGSYGPCHTNT